MAKLAHIRCHPIKTLGADDLDSVQLIAGQVLPGDRTYAVMHEAALKHLKDGKLTSWLPKAAFLRGAASPALQAVKGGWHDGKIHLSHPDHKPILLNPDDPDDQTELLRWLTPLWGTDRPAPARLVRCTAPLTDQSTALISILSLSSLRELEGRFSASIGTDRWRGNLWVEDWPPLAEAEMVGQNIKIGDVELTVVKPITRCAAVNVDTETGQVDGDMLAQLNSLTGTKDFGIFAEVKTSGAISIGDEVSP